MPRPTPRLTSVSSRDTRTTELFVALDLATETADRDSLVGELICLNLPLADALAVRYLGRGAERDDLVQVARVALVLAVHRFRSSAGTSFVAFAVPTITGELKRHFRDHCWVIRPPRQVQELRVRVVRAREELERDRGGNVSLDELAAHLGLDHSLVAEGITAGANYRPDSLEARAAAWNGAGGTVAADQDDVAQRLDLRRALAGLSEADRQVLAWRFGDELTQFQIGQRLGVSQMQVSRVLRRVLDRTRGLLTSPALAA